MCCMLGLTINHSTFICTRFNDPLTTSVAGSVKNIIMTCIGAVSFGDFIYAKWNVVGLGVSMMGAVWYATRAAMKVGLYTHKNPHLACFEPHLDTCTQTIMRKDPESLNRPRTWLENGHVSQCGRSTSI